MPDRLNMDVVVLGSGVAGLTAALTAALAGLRTVVLEHMPEIGGTSARSSGTVWIPDNHYLRARGIDDDRETAEQYLAALVDDRGPPEIWHAFLDQGPRMLRDLEDKAGITFRPFMTAPDYRQDRPGAASGGRALEPLPFDGRTLGEDFERLGRPLPELMIFGGMMVTRSEAAKLLRADRSPSAMLLGLKLVGRYLADRMAHSRGTRLVLGNALVARLLKAASEHGVTVHTNIRARGLTATNGHIIGVDATGGDGDFHVEAHRGVILAGGGFPANPVLRRKYLPSPTPEYTPAADGCDGSTIDLGLAAGASLGPDGFDNGLWFPSSIAERADGSTAVWPHIVLDRSKPGLIAVNSDGCRFTNEAVSYHEFVRAMYGANTGTTSVPAWLVCDRAFIRRYGLGLIRPRTPSVTRYVRSGYLIEATSLHDLADRIGIHADRFVETVSRYNDLAQTGVDKDFGKGETIYDRSNGDPDHRPNPCIGPIERAPFYALAVWPTPLGTSRGLVADIHGRACREDGSAIDGLYVCGNDMQSAFGGEYPGAGGQLGQAMTFAWIAANHAASRGGTTITEDAASS